MARSPKKETKVQLTFHVLPSEREVIVAAAEYTRRSLSSFMRNATLREAHDKLRLQTAEQEAELEDLRERVRAHQRKHGGPLPKTRPGNASAAKSAART